MYRICTSIRVEKRNNQCVNVVKWYPVSSWSMSRKELPSFSSQGAIQLLIAQYLSENHLNDSLVAFLHETGLEFNPVNKTTSGQLMRILTEYDELRSVVANPQHGRLEEDSELLEIGDAEPACIYRKQVFQPNSLTQGNLLVTKFSPEGDYLAVAGTSGDIFILDGTTFEQVSKLSGLHKGAIVTLEFHPVNPNLLLTGSMDKSVCIIDTSRKEVQSRFAVHSKYVVRVKWHPSGTWFASASYDHDVVLFQQSNGDSYVEAKRFSYDTAVEVIEFYQHYLIMAPREDHCLHIYDMDEDRRFKCNMNANGDSVVSFSVLDMVFHPSMPLLLVATDRSRYILFQWEPFNQVMNYYGTPSDEMAQVRVCFSIKGSLFYGLGCDRYIHVYDVKSGNQVHTIDGHQGVVRSITHHPFLPYVCSTAFDKSVRLWSDVISPEEELKQTQEKQAYFQHQQHDRQERELRQQQKLNREEIHEPKQAAM